MFREFDSLTVKTKINMASKKAVSTKPKKKEEVMEEEDELLEEDDELLEEDEDEEDELEEDDEDEEDEDELEDDEEEDDEESDDEDDEEEDEDELEDDEDEDDEESDDEDEEEDEDLDDEEDDEDEDDDDEDEDDEEEDDEEEEPAPKKSSKKTAKSPAKSSKKAPAKKEAKKATKKSAPAAKSFEEHWAEVEAKVENWNGGKVSYAKDGTKIIPQSPVVSNELLYNLIATFDSSDAWKDFVEKIVGKVSSEIKEDIKESRDSYNITGNDVAPVVVSIFETLYKLCSVESGFKLFSTEDCIATVYGNKVEGKIVDNSRLNVSKGKEFSKIEDYIQIKVKSPAPDNKKQLGTMNGKKFVPFVEKKADKKDSAKSGKKAPAKKTSKKK